MQVGVVFEQRLSSCGQAARARLPSRRHMINFVPAAESTPILIHMLRNKTWRRRFWSVVGFLLFLSIAAHPELRLLLPILDVLGVDVFLALMGAQIVSLALPYLQILLRWIWSASAPVARWLASAATSIPLLRGLVSFLGYGIFHWLGRPGPALWFAMARALQRWQLGPLVERNALTP